MKKSVPAANPEDYLAALTGWQKETVSYLRAEAMAAGNFEEKIKWGHLVYFSKGPVFLIRAEEERVLFGFWRGQRLRHLDARLKPGGKYEMATITLTEQTLAQEIAVKKLVAEAAALNGTLGDPTQL